jgi:hypothetical protein
MSWSMRLSLFAIGFGAGLAIPAAIDGIWWLVMIGAGLLILGLSTVGGRREDG